MKKPPRLLLMALCSGLCGCDNASINPTVAKARSEQRQESLMREQIELQLREIAALERIATAIERAQWKAKP